MYCRQCGKSLDDNQKFCMNCGAPTNNTVPSQNVQKKTIQIGGKEIGEKEYKIMNYYLEGNTYQEIAEKMSMKVKTVTNYIQKVRTKLKKWDIK